MMIIGSIVMLFSIFFLLSPLLGIDMLKQEQKVCTKAKDKALEEWREKKRRLSPTYGMTYEEKEEYLRKKRAVLDKYYWDR